MERSKVQVQFRDISYEAEVQIGSAGLPSVGNSFKKLLQVGLLSCRASCRVAATPHCPC